MAGVLPTAAGGEEALAAFKKEPFDVAIVDVKEAISKRLKLGDKIAIMKDGAFVQVGTPQDMDGSADMSFVLDCARSVARAAAAESATRSTSPVDATRPRSSPRSASTTTASPGSTCARRSRPRSINGSMPSW